MSRSLIVKKLVFLVQTVSMGQVGVFVCVFFFFSQSVRGGVFAGKDPLSL